MSSNVPSPSVCSPETEEGHAPGEPEGSLGLSVDVVHVAGGWGDVAATYAAVEAAAGALAADRGLQASAACVALSSDAEVQKLNAAYRGKPVPTNVLSFSPSADAPLPPGEVRYLGDLVLAAETVAREATELGLTLHDHLQHLVVHGLLHLLGFDHQTEAEAHEMESLEIKILDGMGVANPYQAASEPFPPGRHQTETTKT